MSKSSSEEELDFLSSLTLVGGVAGEGEIFLSKRGLLVDVPPSVKYL